MVTKFKYFIIDLLVIILYSYIWIKVINDYDYIIPCIFSSAIILAYVYYRSIMKI